MNVWFLLGQFYVEEYDHASDIVHDVILFLLPFEVRLAHDCLSGLLGIFAFVIRQDNLRNVIVAEELPDTVTCQDDETVLRTQVELKYF